MFQLFIITNMMVIQILQTNLKFTFSIIDDGSRDLTYEFEKFATEWQGAFRIGTVDCYEQYELCDKEQITKTPTVRVYPILPIPAYDFEVKKRYF